MASRNWVLRDQDTLAEYVSLEDFKGIVQQRIGVSPDHAALLIRDGKLVQAFAGGHFSVGGVWQGLKNMIGGEHAVRLLVADLKPFQVDGEIDGLSADQVPLAAAVTVEFQLNPEKPENILGLIQQKGSLTRTDVYERLIPHLRDRVFASVLGQVKANEVRGNIALQDKIQADMMLETQRLFGDIGLMVRSASLNWALNDEERAAVERRRRERQREMLDHDFEHKKRELERENEAKEFVLRSDLAAEKLRATTEDELKHLMLSQELQFVDTRDDGIRAQQLKKLDHEIELLNVERQASYTRALADATNAVERARLSRELTEVELQIEEMRSLQRLKLNRLEEDQKLDIAERARRQQIETMRGLSEVELEERERASRIDREDRTTDHQMELQRKQLETQSELERLRTQASMTPEQLLAINAGLSPDVARIFSERARAESTGSEQQMALLREMVSLSKEHRVSSDEQARALFTTAMDGVVAASRGGSGGSQPHNPGGADETSAQSMAQGATPGTAQSTAECASCHRATPSSDRFCRYCGHQMRT